MKRPMRARLVAILLALPLVAMLLATTALAAPSKPIFVDIKPQISNDISIAADDVAKGTCVIFDVTLRNDTKTQQLGSANYTLDPALDYDNVGCTGVTNPTPNGTATLTGLATAPLVELRDLAAGPGVTVLFSFQATVPCTAGTGAVTYDDFSVITKQANNYQGDPGNNQTVATGSDFDIQAVGLCQTFAATETASGSINGSAANSNYTVQAVTANAGTLILAKGVNSINCGDYVEHTDTVTVDFTGTAEKILTFKFPNSTHQQKSEYRVCFASPDAWTDRSGTEITDPAQASLLPDCNSTTAPTNLPCMLPVTIQGQQVTIKAWLRPGDPPGRG